MKSIKRKLLSLVLAMAMVLTLAPTALATEQSFREVKAELNATSSQVDLTATLPEGVTLGESETITWAAIKGNASEPTPLTGVTGATAHVAYTSLDAGASYTFKATVTIGESEDAVTYTGTSSSVTIPSSSSSTDPVATSIGFYDAAGTTKITGNAVTMAADSNSVTVTVKVLDASGNVTGNATVKSVSTSGTTATANAAGGTITISRKGSGGGATTFTFTDQNNFTAELTVNVTAQASSSSVSAVTIGFTGGIASVPVGGTLGVNVGNIEPPLPTPNGYDKITWTSSDTTILTVSGTTDSATVTGVKAGQATVTVVYSKNNVEVARGTSRTITVTGASGVDIAFSIPTNFNVYTNTFSGYGSSVTATATVNGTAVSSANPYYCEWSRSDYYNNYYYDNVIGLSYTTNAYSTRVTAYNNGTATLTVKVYAATPSGDKGTYVGEKTVIVYVGNSNSSYLASVNVTNSYTYSLGNRDDANGSSIVSQLSGLYYTIGYYAPYAVQFTGSTTHTYGSLSANSYTTYSLNSSGANYLGNVVFTPSNSAGRAIFSVRVYFNNGSTNFVDGTICFDTSGNVYAGDITYSASIGSDVSFYLKDFENYYYNRTMGTLSYVTFSLPSGGTLYSDSGRLNSGNACYVSPGWNQVDLSGVYFSPTGTTATRANTVRINFTAYGNRANTSGTVVITYLAGSAKDIIYNIYTSGALNANDFTEAYRQAVGGTAPTSLTIEFQTAPAYGTLSYKDSSRSSSSAVSLRSSNIKSYKFTTLSTGSNRLNDVTYTANGNHSDTIEYVAYVNSTPQFTGKVIFNGSNTSASNMQVGFTSTGGQAVAFSYAEFSKANAAVIASTSYIRFVTMPTGGTLTYNGAVVTLSSTNVPPALLGSVVYRPNAGFNNSSDRISFLCYDANGNSVGGGQVSIVVTGNGSSGSAGASNVNQFRDVPTTAWYRDDLSRLVSAGIIQGKGDGKFDPNAKLTYGEALKIFMLASGYPAQQEPSGKNWAANYKALAVSNGWISNDVDLSAKISRNSMAELVAKSLGISPTDGVPPTWRDGTSNGYSNALYYTNPQILIGNGDGTFQGTSTLSRDQICAIACRVMNYRSGQQSANKPSWVG